MPVSRLALEGLAHVDYLSTTIPLGAKPRSPYIAQDKVLELLNEKEGRANGTARWDASCLQARNGQTAGPLALVFGMLRTRIASWAGQTTGPSALANCNTQAVRPPTTFRTNVKRIMLQLPKPDTLLRLRTTVGG